MGPGEYLEIYDSHAHYDDKAFDSDRAWLLEKQLPLSGVRCVINMGTRLLTCASTVGLSDLNPYIFAAVGIHPEEIDDTLPENWLECLRVWLENGDAVAVGEIGLDYHWPDSAPRERQREVFAAQLALAKELNHPVLVPAAGPGAPCPPGRAGPASGVPAPGRCPLLLRQRRDGPGNSGSGHVYRHRRGGNL